MKRRQRGNHWPSTEEQRRRSQANRELIASGAFQVGDRVLTWNDQRIGTVVALNQATVRVHLIGRMTGGWTPELHTISPEYLEAVDGDPEPHPVGSVIRFRPWNPRIVRDGVVAAVDHALMLVEYTDHNGFTRREWIDRLRVQDTD